MKCLACDKILTDREANRKYPEWQKIKNPEERYIGLCNFCIRETDLVETIGEDLEIVTETNPDEQLE